MLYTLENQIAKVVVSSHAAEIHSFIKKDENIEYMWQGDPKFWSGRNPTLFPQVSNTRDGIHIFKNQRYIMGNHGFTRHSDFTLVSSDATDLILSLKDNAETYQQYPYHFELLIHFHLDGLKLNINYEIHNLDEAVMPFGFGLHPAFNCPMADDRFEDYRIEFENAADNQFEMINDQTMNLNYELFEKYSTVILKDFKSKYVTLTNGQQAIRVHTAGFPLLAFWTKPELKAPFVCIEPWHSYDNSPEIDLPFNDRKGIINLEAGKTFTTDYAIEIL